MSLFKSPWAKVVREPSLSAHGRLIAILQNEKDVSEILRRPPGQITPEQKEALKRIVFHLIPPPEGGSAGTRLTNGQESLAGVSSTSSARPNDVAAEETSSDRPDADEAESIDDRDWTDSKAPAGEAEDYGTTSGEDEDQPVRPWRPSRSQRAGETAVADPAVANEDDEDDEEPPRKVVALSGGRPPAAKDPWKAFLRIKKLQLPAAFAQHLREYGPDPLAFLNDQRYLQHDGIGIQYDHTQATDAFVACYHYTLDLADRRKMDTWRWHFNMLMYHDFVKLIKPAGSGRIGHLMQAEMIDRLKPLAPILNIDLKKLNTKIQTWALQGRKLDILCAEFGPGCIFFLQSLLTSYFLTKKFTASGSYKESAFRHLHSLGLKERADKSRANRLANGVRACLIRPFHDADLDV